MTGKPAVVLTLTALTLVWAVGASSFAQTVPPHPALLLAQQQQQQAPRATPSPPSSAPQLANEKHPTKPMPPGIVEDGSMSHAGRVQSYPDLPAQKPR